MRPRGTPSIERPHSARVYDYWLGGKNNFAIDRRAGDAVLQEIPQLRAICRANRAFMCRSAQFVAQAGVQQFVDIGTGIPTEPNLHQVVQSVRPSARVVYVDNDSVVLAHAAALMRGDPRGRTVCVEADARDPQKIVESPILQSVVDFGQPVGVSLIALLHFIHDNDHAQQIVGTLMKAMPSGSYLTISHATGDRQPQLTARAAAVYRDSGVPFKLRTKAEVEALFAGFDLVEPGVLPVPNWRPRPGAEPATDGEICGYGGVARKP